MRNKNNERKTVKLSESDDDNYEYIKKGKNDTNIEINYNLSKAGSKTYNSKAITTKSQVEYFPFAINFKRLQLYSNHFLKDLYHIIVFEHLLTLSNYFIENHNVSSFYHSLHNLSAETLLTEHKVRQIIKYFEKKELIKTDKKGVHNITYYEINYSKLETLLDLIVDKDRIYDKKQIQEHQKRISSIKKFKGMQNGL